MKRLLLLLIITILFFSCADKKHKKEDAGENTFYTTAIKYRGEERSDSAFLYFNKAKDWFLQAEDSLGAGKCLVNMAAISIRRGDYFGGQELSLQALNYIDGTKEKHLPYVRANLNELGIASFELKNYAQALSFYRQSLTYTTDSAGVLVLRNNMANAYRKLHDFKKALSMYSAILEQDLDTIESARVRTNLAFTKWLQDPAYVAAPELISALHTWEKANDTWGQNLSYSNLSDYYMRSKPDSALFYATSMYAVARQNNNPDDQLDALQKLVRLAAPQAARRYFLTYQRLSDSIQTVRNAAKNQFALIRYETEKHKADNFRLQKENGEKRYQLVISIAALVAALLIFLFLYQRRKKKTQETLRENRLRISQRVHDVVANGLHTMLTDLKYREHVPKEKVISKLFRLYNQSRDISNEITSPGGDDFHLTLAILFQYYDSDETSVTPAGNHKELWEGVSEHSKKEIECVLQELMVNMAKHSKAREVGINFTREGNRIHIQYTDDGIGLPAGIIYGNGIQNTESRIKSIAGSITFGSSGGEGLDVRVVIPVA